MGHQRAVATPNLQGFTTDISVLPGQTQRFKVDTTGEQLHARDLSPRILRWRGRRKIATVTPTTATNQPNCLTSASTGLVDCGNWSVSASWLVPSTAVSGIYIAKLTQQYRRREPHSLRRSRGPCRRASFGHDVPDLRHDLARVQPVRRQQPVCRRAGTNPGRAYKVSYNRPITTRGTGARGLPSSTPSTRWCAASKRTVTTSATRRASTRTATAPISCEHKVFLSVGHDEYWSGPQRANVEAARAAGVHLAFFSGNEMFWKTRWENSIDGSGTPYRTLVCYKETHANAMIDPVDPPTWTGTWGDPRFSPPADGGRRRTRVTGQMFGVNDGDTTCDRGSRRVRQASLLAQHERRHLAAGATATMPNGTLGYEWDGDIDNGVRPPRLMRLSQLTRDSPQKLLDYGSTYGSGTVTHALTLVPSRAAARSCSAPAPCSGRGAWIRITIAASPPPTSA